MIVNLKFLNGNNKEITVKQGQTIQDIKQEYLNLDISNLNDIKIIYSGRILENSQLIEELSLNENSFFVILTTTKSALESLSKDQENTDDDTVDSDDDDDSSVEFMNGDLFSLVESDKKEDQEQEKDQEQEQEQDIDYSEVIEKNNLKFMELIKDSEFNTLINIILNKPEYLNYALKFVQSGMIFNRPESFENNQDEFKSQVETLYNLNLSIDKEKISKALQISNGDLQIAIRYLYQSKFDENFSL